MSTKAEFDSKQNDSDIEIEQGEEYELLLGAESEQEPVISVVMPTMNEEEGIVECIERIKTGLTEVGLAGEILVSDDSTDRTPELAREHGAIVVEPDGEGYGYAYRYAFERTRGEYIVMGDADTTYDFEQIPRLLEPVKNGDVDMMMGSRLEGEIRDGAMPTLHQYIGNPLLTKFLNVFYSAGVSDAHSGFRVFTREAYEEMGLETDGMEFASEMIMEAGARDLTIGEQPIVYHERQGEEKLESFRDGWRHVRFMLVNAPGYLFSVPGLLMGLVGLFLMGLAGSGVTIGQANFGIRTMIAGSLLTIVGYQIGSFGVFSSIAANPIQEPRDPVSQRLRDGISLERGAGLGLGMFTVGVGYAGYTVFQWVTAGYGTLPSLLADVAAFTLIVLGLQTLFGSFFMSTLADRS
ncbi:glycosyltransferase family 2 protein [Haloarchaeobius iranensis]|uniref:Glycosyltransferase involved in cell wall bisynthesis n=1 Tax=Haloarchaeobius iranensis TaxID=996166 RepID=A0A1H0ADE6_9EURY|nr:glycosyltransferase family 2 protein [Haloarchaeobius iranensis]SDN31652.1 Glycosyltransferase involved in cell wall bisynthesis [Haloarchaeobius iranensis]